MGALDVLDEQKKKGTFYDKTAVSIGAFIGGPLGAGYFLIENYKALDQREKIGMAWAITIVSSVLVFGLAALIPEEANVPNVSFTLPILIAARQIYQQYQEAEIEKYLENGGELYSRWNVFGKSVLMLLITFVVFMGGFFLFEGGQSEVAVASFEATTASVEDVQVKSYGDVGHVIVFDQAQISDLEIDGIATELTALGFFDLENQKSVYLDIDGNHYEFSIIDATVNPQDADTQSRYETLRAEINEFLSNQRVSLLLMDEELNEVLARFD